MHITTHLLITPYLDYNSLHPSGEALYRTQRNTEITNNEDEDSTSSCPHMELLRGCDGQDAGMARMERKETGAT